MALDCTVCLSFVWSLCLVSRYMNYFSAVFMFLPFVGKNMGFKTVLMRLWNCRRCSANFDFAIPCV
jgi:hypothetical protein